MWKICVFSFFHFFVKKHFVKSTYQHNTWARVMHGWWLHASRIESDISLYERESFFLQKPHAVLFGIFFCKRCNTIIMSTVNYMYDGSLRSTRFWYIIIWTGIVFLTKTVRLWKVQSWMNHLSLQRHPTGLACWFAGCFFQNCFLSPVGSPWVWTTFGFIFNSIWKLLNALIFYYISAQQVQIVFYINIYEAY